MKTNFGQRLRGLRTGSLPSLIGIVALGLTILSISIPNLLRSRIAANEASAVGSVRTLNAAVASYVGEHPAEGYPQKLSDLTPYIDGVLANGEKSGYKFSYEPQVPYQGAAATGFKVVATPSNDQTGVRRFSMNETGVINYQASASQPEKPLDGGSSPQTERRPVAGTRRMLRKGSMTLIVADPAPVAERIRAVSYRLNGYVDTVRLSDEGYGAKRVSIAIRVPSARFDEARREVRALGERVKSEEDDAQDVTAQYVDLESNLRNFHAEEMQYLDIMRRSGTIKDTLAVAERLADVRGRIERTQGQLNLLSHQTELAVLDVTLCTESIAQPVDVRWHPRAQVRAAFWDAADDLSTYANFMIAVFFRLPVFALWLVTVLASALCSWRLLRWLWQRFGTSSLPAA
jgi:type IV pilus assembly protein PilA